LRRGLQLRPEQLALLVLRRRQAPLLGLRPERLRLALGLRPEPLSLQELVGRLAPPLLA
jgi:hypothetical protein